MKTIGKYPNFENGVYHFCISALNKSNKSDKGPIRLVHSYKSSMRRKPEEPIKFSVISH